MIAGIGVDIVDVARIQGMLDRHGEHFINRVYTEGEIAYAMSGANKAERFAGRFAAKEAVLKALGIGLSQGVRWKDVETRVGRFGKPEIHLHGEAVKWAKWRNGDQVHVTITHDGGKAVAFVIFEKTGANQ
jgi:holo-[acyl-carrier protein] synthase